MDNETRFQQIEATIKDTNDLLNGAAKVILGLAEKVDRTQHHLDILAELVIDVIRDRRYRDLEQRIQRLEEGGGKAA
jgi:hypothetical protein